jgi:hydroxymethylpyrimidine/phosphomethylpyrimidine kinase
MMHVHPLVLVISGLDPTGGAGIVSDIRAITVAEARFAAVISAVTAQGKNGVASFHCIPVSILKEQLDILFKEYAPDIAKIGMLGCSETARFLGEYLSAYPDLRVILDPINRASAGGELCDEQLAKTILEHLLPYVDLVTPNLFELSWLSGIPRKSGWIDDAAKVLLNTGCGAVLVKGGHGSGHPTDILFTQKRKMKWSGTRLPGHIRGTGCHLASYIAAQMALGRSLETSIRRARNYVRLLFRGYSRAGAYIRPAWRPERWPHENIPESNL